MIVAITDPRYALDAMLRAIDRVRAVLPDHAFVVQHRDKVSPPDAREQAFARLRATGACVVLNGTPEDARRLGAHGVHLPGEAPDLAHAREVLGDDAWISISAHHDDAIAHAVEGRATAALVSPIFDVPGKGPTRGVDALARARAIAGDRLRIVALGGVDPRRAASCMRAGADGIAVIRTIFEASDPAAVALELTAAFGGRP